MKPWLFRRLINLWPPFLGAGIRVREISSDWRYVRVELVANRLNRNHVGTHFGVSLFAMTDPFLMLMYLKALESDCVVWDHSASIRFVKPGRGTVAAEFCLEESDLEEVRRAVAGGERYLKEHEVRVMDADGECVARVERTLYFRLKERNRPLGRG